MAEPTTVEVIRPTHSIAPSPGQLGVGASIGYPADPADRLPATARNRLKRLRDERDDLRASLMAASERFNEAQRSMNDIRLRAESLGSQLSRSASPQVRTPEHPALVALNAEAVRVRREHEHAQGRVTELNEKWQEAGRLVENCEAYLASVNEPISEFNPASKPLAEHEMLETFDKVPEIRRHVARIKDEISAVQAAPLLRADAKRVMRAQIAALAAAGKPSISQLLAHGGAISFPSARTSTQPPFLQLMPDDAARQSAVIAAAANVNSRSPDGISFSCWLFQNQIIEQLDRDIDQADDRKALSSADRAAELDRLKAELLRWERAEVTFCEVDHAALRSDTDPRAVLRVIGPAP